MTKKHAKLPSVQKNTDIFVEEHMQKHHNFPKKMSFDLV